MRDLFDQVVDFFSLPQSAIRLATACTAIRTTVIRIKGFMVAGIGGSQAVPKVSQRISLSQACRSRRQTTAAENRRRTSVDSVEQPLQPARHADRRG